MRPPNPRMADSGDGPDTIQIFTLGIDPVLNTDAEGNWVRTPVASSTFLAIVTPGFATGLDGDGTTLSVTTYQVMLYSDLRPSPITTNPIVWKKSGVYQGTLNALGEAAPSGPGCWAFQASETGPNPDTSGVPEGA
jgi:hypothetical protein